MKTLAKLKTTISVEDIDMIIIERARVAISEDLRIYPNPDSAVIEWLENGEAVVSFDYEEEH